jgi:hypothetical protein
LYLSDTKTLTLAIAKILAVSKFVRPDGTNTLVAHRLKTLRYGDLQMNVNENTRSETERIKNAWMFLVDIAGIASVGMWFVFRRK